MKKNRLLVSVGLFFSVIITNCAGPEIEKNLKLRRRAAHGFLRGAGRKREPWLRN